MKQIVKMAHYWTQEVKRLSTCTVVTEPAPQVWEQKKVQEIPSTQVVERTQKQIAETILQERDQRTIEQNMCMSVPTVRHVQEISGSQVVERIQKQIVDPVPQKRGRRIDEQNACVSFTTVGQRKNVCMSVPLAAPRAATVASVDVHTTPPPVIDLIPSPVTEHITPSAVSYSSFGQIHEARVSVPTVQEQMNVQVIPDAQVMEQIQKQIVETVPQGRDQRVQGIPELQVVEQLLEQAVEASQVRLLERVQQRVDAQSKRLFERLEEFHKRLEMSEARRTENDKFFREIGALWKERKQQERGQLNGSVLEPIPEHP